MDIKKNLYRGFRNRGLPVLLSVLLFASCQDDLQTSVHTGPGIHFSVSDGANWHTTRAGGSPAEETVPRDSLTGVLPLQAADGGEGLFLHAMISDGIEATGANGQTDEPQTRGSLIVGADNFHDSFGVMASVYTGSWNEDACLPDYMYNVEVTKASSWTTSYYWPGAGQNIRFFAYAPYKLELEASEKSELVVSGKTQAGTPSLTHMVSDKVSLQKDLLVAVSDEISGNSSSTVPLTFKHVLTAVRFVTGEDMLPGNVLEVRLEDVYRKATLRMGSDAWEEHQNKFDFSMGTNLPLDGSENQEITDEKWWFMMIPQTLPEGAQIVVVYADKLTGTKRTLTASIAGTEWPMGKTVTYRISTSSISVLPTFEVTAPEAFTYTGGNTQYSVTSYATVSRVGDETKTVPLRWTAEFVEDDGKGGYNVISRPGWVKAFNERGDGSTEASSQNVWISAQQAIISNPHDEILKKAAPVSEVYDLCTKGGTTPINSANCYIINAPGIYSLPLIYGNAIKDGDTNASAYTSQSSERTVLKTFVNHLDTAITDPYIYNNAGCVPLDAVLVWQDQPGLVTNVRLSSDKHSLTFDVLQPTINQGNAIVAVRDTDSRIMWSWHIWVTDFVPGLPPTVEERYDPVKTARDKVVTNYEGQKKTVMGLNIGWCYGDIIDYEPRSVKVRFTQAETGLTRVITFTQQEKNITEDATCTLFQHGRKDPMPGGTRHGEKTVYSESGYEFNPSGNGWISIGKAIQNPHIFYNFNNMHLRRWNSAYYLNLWSADNATMNYNNNPVVKTIYDPCPVGYCMPSQKDFTGFTSTGSPTTGEHFGSQFNSPYTSKDEFTDNIGWVFYCNKMTAEGVYDTSGGTIFFPATGVRNKIPSQLSDFGIMAGYWYAPPTSYEEARSLRLLETTVDALFGHYLFWGFPIRPVRE